MALKWACEDNAGNDGEMMWNNLCVSEKFLNEPIEGDARRLIDKKIDVH